MHTQNPEIRRAVGLLQRSSCYFRQTRSAQSSSMDDHGTINLISRKKLPKLNRNYLINVQDNWYHGRRWLFVLIFRSPWALLGRENIQNNTLLHVADASFDTCILVICFWECLPSVSLVCGSHLMNVREINMKEK